MKDFFRPVPSKDIWTPNAERGPIGISDLVISNGSDISANRRDVFEKNKGQRRIVLVKRCSDSRYLLDPTRIITIPIIGAGNTKDRFAQVYNLFFVENIVVLPHDPCGGLKLKEQHHKEGEPENPSGIHAHTKEGIDHHEPYSQALVSAQRVSSQTDKYVLAAVEFQKDGSIDPIRVYKDGKVVSGTYVIGDIFGEFLQENQDYVGNIRAKYPNLAEIQEVQNPDIIFISEEMGPPDRNYAPLCDPLLADRSGKFFRTRLPRPANVDQPFVNHRDAEITIRQLHYPIVEFSKAKRMLIEGKNLDRIKDFAKILREQVWGAEWEEKEDNIIYLGININGVLEHIEELPKAA